jgi:hypothetical protein
MPIPVPSPKQSRDEYISKCMHALKDEKRPQDQKIAICFSQWKKAKKKKKSKGSSEEPKWEEQSFEDGYTLI